MTAEGVDDPLSLSLLRVMGCDMIQGYEVSPALPLDALIAFLAERRHRPADRTPGLAAWRGTGLTTG